MEKEFAFVVSLIVSLAFSLSLSICAQEPWVPPQVQRTEPILYPLSLDPKPWMDQSVPTRVSQWFTITDKGWYINWDAERLPLMMIIIHHSATEDDATPEEIAAINKQKLWDPYYKSDDPDPYLKGLEPHTGHSIGGKETFICYHHLVYWDGRVTTELQPLIYINGRWYIDMVVWHAGNMVVNCCSISICMVGNFDEKPPPASQIEAAQKLINYYKLFNPNVVVLPHRRIVDLRTDCPGNTWDQWGPLLEK